MNEVIEILGRETRRIIYRDVPVVTLPQIDDVHKRADGNARKQFNRNKSRFEEGRDFFKVPMAEVAGQFDTPPYLMGGGNRGGIYLFTERGYGKIVKGLNDDLSWRLHDAMQDSYFREKEAIAATPAPAEFPLDTRMALRGVVDAILHGSGSVGGVLKNLSTATDEIKAVDRKVHDLIITVGGISEQIQGRSDKWGVWRESLIKEVVTAMSNAGHGPPAPEPCRIFYEHEWLDVDRIYRAYYPGIEIPNRGFLSNSVSKQLQNYCLRTGRQMDARIKRDCARDHIVWHVDVIAKWHEHQGQHLIGNHIKEYEERAAKKSGNK